MTLSIMTLVMMALSIMTLVMTALSIMTLSIMALRIMTHATQLNDTEHIDSVHNNTAL